MKDSKKMKPEIEWICTLSGVDEVMPIIKEHPNTNTSG